MIVQLILPSELWRPIRDAPRDGSIVWIRDARGNVDLAQWSHFEWSAEFGQMDGPPVEFAGVSISGEVGVLADALRELHDFAAPATHHRRAKRSQQAFVRAGELLRRLGK